MEPNTSQEEEWKRMQVKTFTRWCNARLAVQQVTVEDLSTDLCDGVKLIVLLEVLSQKRLGKFNKKPRMHAQRMENVEIALQFITQKEKIRLVNIGSGDIVGGNLKLILGLIWTLILHYQIKNLLNYLEHLIQLPGKKIRNVTTDWNDGILLATLVDSVARGLCPECDEMLPEKALQNVTHAMTLAEEWLSVPQVLNPADMVNPNVDELSMMTYLSQFLTAKLKPGAPLKPTGNPLLVKVFGPGIQKEGVNMTMPSALFTVDTEGAGPGKVIDVSKVNIYGTGLSGGIATKWAEFTIDSSTAGEGKSEVSISGPTTVQPTLQSGSDGVTKVKFLPAVPGKYTITILFGNQTVPGSPFFATFSKPETGKVYVISGPGLKQDGIVVNATAQFSFDSKSAASEKFTVMIVGPVTGAAAEKHTQSPHAIPTVIKNTNGTYNISYKPQLVGLYRVHLYLNGQELQESPIPINVTDPTKVNVTGPWQCSSFSPTFVLTSKEMPCDVTKVTVYGTGVGDDGAQTGSSLSIFIDTRSAGLPGHITATLTKPHGEISGLHFKPDKKEGIYFGEYISYETGCHKLSICIDDKPIPKSPFTIPLCKPTAVKLSGSGLDGAIAKIPNTINILTDEAGPGKVAVEFEGPSNADKVEYTLKQISEHNYQLSTTQGRTKLNGSPFIIKVVNRSGIKLNGPGITGSVQIEQTKHYPYTEQLHWIVDYTSTGFEASDIIATMNGELGYSQKLAVTEKDASHASITFAPNRCGPYKLQVLAGGQEVPHSPVNISLQDVNRVTASGPGLVRGCVGKPVTVTFDTTQAGEGSLSLQIQGPANVTPACTSEEPGTFVVKLEPTKAGAYTLKAMYGDKDIPGSPFSIPVIDPDEVAVSGTAVTGKGLGVGKKAEVFVDTTQAGNCSGQGHSHHPIWKDIPLSLVPTETDGVLHGDYVPDEPGKHKLHVNFNEEPIPQSPYDVLVPSQEECSVTEQEDLQSAPSGFHDLPQLVIDTPVGEPGAVEAWVDAPNQKQLQCSVTNQGDKCKVSFFPLTTGMHLVHVTRNKLPVQGSPFPVNVTAQQVLNIEGPEVTQLAVGQPVKLEVSEGVEGKGELKAPTLFTLTHGNRLVRGSPFVVKVFNPLEVKLSGPGVVDSEEDNAQPKPLPLDQQLEWTVDFTSAGLIASDLSATVYGLEGYSQKLAVTDKDAYHASITFAPNRCGPYKLQVLAGGQEVPHSPVNISLQDVNRVTASGPGLVGGCVGKPVTVTFDTTQAGEGSLSLQIQGPANVTPACTSEEPGTFVVKFEPTKAGAYTLKAMYGDKDIPGSPFSIPVIDPAEVAVSGTAVTGKGLGVGKKAEVLWTQLRPATLRSRPQSPPHLERTFPCPWFQPRLMEFCTEIYVPDEPGKHKLHVNFNEEPIPQSPYDVLVPSQEECSVTEQEDLQSAPSGFHDLPQLVIDTPVGEPGAVEAWVDAPNQKQLQCSVTNQGDKCKVSFFPLTTGMHLVHVTRNKLPVQGSPFPVNVTAQQVLNIEGPEVTQLAVGQPVKLEVSEGVEGKGELKVNVEGPADCRVETKQNPDSTYTIELTPTLAGTYLVHLTHGNRLVRGSPFVVKVFNPLEVKLSGPGVVDSEEDNAQPKPLPLDQQLEWTVDFTSAGLVASDLSATVYGLEGYSQKLAVTDKDAYHASIAFAPNRCGPYKLQVLAGGQEVPHSPVNISLQDVNRVTASGPVIDPAEVAVSGTAVTGKGLGVGKKAEVFVDTTQAGNAPVKATVTTPSGKDIPLSLVPTETDGVLHGEYVPDEPEAWVDAPNQKQLQCSVTNQGDKCKVSFFPLTTGMHLVHVTRNKLPVQGSPFPVNVTAQQVLNIEGPEVTQLAVGQPVKLEVSEGVEGKGELEVNVEGPADCRVETKQNPDSTYTIELTPTLAGTYLVHLTHGNRLVRGSPFVVKVFNPLEVKLSGPGVVDSEEDNAQPKPLPLDQQLEWTVDFTSAGLVASDLSATVYGLEGYSQKLAVTDKDAYHASITFAPNRCGPYKLQVLAGGQEVPHSPVNISLQDVNRVTASGPGLVGGCVGKPVTVTFDTTQAGEGSLSLQIQGPANVTPACTSEEPGTFVVKFEAHQGRSLHTESHERELGVGKKAEVFVDTTQAGNAPVKATVTTPSGKDIPLSLVPTETDGVLHGEYVPDEPGKHKLHVNFNEEPIPQSPYDVLVPSQEECSVTEHEDLQSAPSGFHDLPQLVIDTPVGEPGAVEAWVDAPNQKQLQCSVTNQGDKCKGELLPSDNWNAPRPCDKEQTSSSGHLPVHLTHGNRLVRGSPFVVKVFNPLEVKLSGPGVVDSEEDNAQPKPLPLDQQLEWTVDFTSAGLVASDLSATVYGLEGYSQKLAVTDKDAYHASITFAPNRCGPYKLQVLAGGQEVPHSPVNISLQDVNRVTASGPGLVGGCVGKPVTVTFDTTQAGEGSLSLQIQGPANVTPACTSEEPGTFVVKFEPTKAGAYTLKAMYGDKDIPGSPFSVPIIDPAEAGNAPVKATVTTPSGKDIPMSLVPTETDGVLHGEYVPVEPGKHKLHVNFNEEPIPQSPYDVLVPSQEECSVTEQEDLQSAPSGFHDLPQLVIDTPVGEPGCCRSLGRCTQSETIAVLRHQPGRQVQVQGSPFPVNVTAQQVLNIEGPEVTQLAVGQPVKLEVSEGVEGKRRAEGTYLVHLTHGNRLVRGSPFVVKVFNPLEVKLSGPGVVDSEEDNAQPKPLPLDQQLEWTVDFTSAGLVASDLSATVYGLEGYSQKLAVTDKDAYHASITFAPNRYKVQPTSLLHAHQRNRALSLSTFEATKAGAYTLKAMYGDKDIPGSPFSIPVIDPAEVSVSGTAVTGKGLGVGKKAEVFVDTTQAGNAPVKATVTTPIWKGHSLSPYDILVPSQEECSVTEQEDLQSAPSGFHDFPQLVIDAPVGEPGAVEAWVDAPNQKTIAVLRHQPGRQVPRNKLPVQGSPFPVNVTAQQVLNIEGPEVTQLAVGQPVKLENPDSTYTIELTPTLAGTYLVHLTHGNRLVRGSPFVVKVFNPLEVKLSGPGVVDSEEDNAQPKLCHVSRVTASGPGLVGGCVGKPVTVTFDTPQAGEGSLSLQIQGPANVTPACTSEEPGTFVVNFEPTKAGAYTLKAMYGDKDIPGSPFSIPVIDPTVVAVSGTAVTGKGLGVGKKAEVFVDTTQAGNAPVKATVTTPSGMDIPLSLVPTETDGVLHGDYVPDEPGKHKLCVTLKEEPISLSPLDILIPCEEQCIMMEQDVEVGTVEAWVEAPNETRLLCTVSKHGEKFRVFFIPLLTGMHYVHVVQNQKPIQGSPFPINVTSQHIFSIRNYQTIQLIANETVHLQVLESVQRAEDLKVLVDGPSDCNVEIKQNANSTYTIELTPKAEGIYLIHIMYCGHLVNGSTLALMVTSLSEQATLVNNSGKNSGIVHNDDNTHDGSKRYCQFAFAVSGPGIEGGELIGQVAFAVKALGECEENVSVEICGPQSCDMMMRNDGDGTTHVQYVPTVPGMYDINITCAGNHIKGSPYRVHWSRPLPDASKCTVSGIENNGRFHIDCRSGGGFGYLEVAVFGAFVPAEDIAIKHNGDFTFDITYKISQPGKTTISVKWHGVHLRGSPFTVYTE
eukprot:Em0011g497a